MRLSNQMEANEFLKAVRKCNGDVFLKSAYGDVYNLKSSLITYVVIGKMLEERGEDLELFCSDKRDEEIFMKLFKEGKLEP